MAKSASVPTWVILAAAVSIAREGGFDEPYAAVMVAPEFKLEDAQAALRAIPHEVRVVVVDEIPRTAGMRKVLRREVRARVATALGC